MYQFLLVVHALVAAALVGVILMQRSEGGGLAGGGNPAGLMTARGAADLLTRMTTILAVLFVTLSIAMAAIATINRTPSTIDTSLAKKAEAPAPIVPMAGGDTAVTPPLTTTNTPATSSERTVEPQSSPVPLASSVRKSEPVKVEKAAPKPEPRMQKPVAKIDAPAEKAVAPAPEIPAPTPPAENVPQ